MSCDFEFRGDALERATPVQLQRLLAFAAGSGATRALITCDFECRPGSPHGMGMFLVVDWAMPRGGSFTTGIGPDGGMHS